MPARPLAVILASAELGRLYTGLSLLVSASADGRGAAGLATFAALAPLLDPELEAHAGAADTPLHLPPLARDIFARSLTELRDMATPSVHACAATAELMGIDDPAPLAGVQSTPRFLAQHAEAELVVV